MTGPVMHPTKSVAPDTHALAATFPVPGYGLLPVRSHLIRASEPVLVDTGLAALRKPFLDELGSLIEPRDIRWIWITHADLDHVGNLEAVLAAAPEATVITTFVGMAKLGLLGIQPPKVHLLNPGQEIEVGDRKLKAVSPPTFDAPETTGLLDTKTGVLFSADSFGALLDAPFEDVNAVEPAKLAEGMRLWATVDAPWLRWTDADLLAGSLDSIRGLGAATVLSSHLPPASSGHTETLIANVASARTAPTFVGPDQAALEQMMAAAQAG